MNCEDVQQKIPLLCGNDLPSEEHSELLFDHIDRCDACQSSLREYRESREVLRQLKDDGMPEEFWKSFQQDLDAKLSELPSPARKSTPKKAGCETSTHSSSSFTRTALVAAAMLLLGLGLGYFGNVFLSDYGSEKASPPESLSPDPSNQAEQTSDDLVTDDSRSMQNAANSQSVQDGLQLNQLQDINQNEPTRSNPIQELKPDPRYETPQSD